MNPTPEQLAVIEADFQGQLQVNAYAGTGKTATLLEYARRRAGEDTLYLAFNKAMATEAQQKFLDQRHVKSMTIHSLAFRAIGKNYQDRLGNLRPMDVTELARPAGGINPFITSRALIDWLNEFMSSDKENIEEFFNAKLPGDSTLKAAKVDPGRFQGALENLWEQVLQDKTFPFPHNAYLKLYQLSKPQLKCKHLLVDEAQDVTDCMIDIVCQQECARLLIGDSYQQIYGWNGAVDSLKKLAHLGEVMFLTQSFRCPEPIAQSANQYLKVLGAEKDFHGTTASKDTDRACLCRTNGGVFKNAIEYMEAGDALHFLGGFDSYNFKILLDIQSMKEGQMNRIQDPFIRCFRDFEELQEYAEYDVELNSKVKIVDTYGPRVRPLYFQMRSEACDRKNADVVLSTGHRSKGQEFGNVRLGNDFISLKEELAEIHEMEEAKQTVTPIEIKQEELNLLYVAMTRSKRVLDCPEIYLLEDKEVQEIRERAAKGQIHIVDAKGDMVESNLPEIEPSLA